MTLNGTDWEFRLTEQVTLERRDNGWVLRGTLFERPRNFATYDEARDVLVQLLTERGDTVNGTDPSLI